jgi:5-(carboxyamino)imidazole ribonucleotide synthase
MVNELALRPHNSGHYTIEGCVTSQFEQHLRAVLGWPLGVTTLTAPAVVTVNVVGAADGSDPRRSLAEALAVPGAHVHLYGKEARPGRKLGHVTVCGEHPGPTREAARLAASTLEGDLS